MARPKLKRATVGSKYVAIGALTEILNDREYSVDKADAVALATHLVDSAWDVEHFPVANKVQITIDLASLDKAADTPQ